MLESSDALEVLRHIGSHGISNTLDPSDSCLLLNNPESDNAPGRLAVKDIASTRNAEVQLAYLSAYFTAENKSKQLADEVIRIANAFQLADFSHIPATMWESEDRVCSEVATEFYKPLLPKEEI